MLPSLLLLVRTGHALDAEFRGQASAWSRETNFSGNWSNQTGIRYLPQLLLEQVLKGETMVDGEVMLNGYSVVSDDGSDDLNLDLYRLKVRLTGARSEIRIGLQKTFAVFDASSYQLAFFLLQFIHFLKIIGTITLNFRQRKHP